MLVWKNSEKRNAVTIKTNFVRFPRTYKKKRKYKPNIVSQN